MRIFGHCRFSWFGISDTGREIASVEEAQQKLWNPYRMAVRFHLFENIMLPSMAAQTDKDFQLVLLTSTDMPQAYHQRLKTVTAPFSFVRLIDTDQRDIGHALRPFMRETVEGGQKAVHFRIDDDDALAASYVERLRVISDRLSPRTAISFSKGFSGFIDGKVARHCERIKPYIAIGLALVTDESFHRNPFQIQHRKVGRWLPSYLDPGFHAWHHSLHVANNTNGYAESGEELAGLKPPSPRRLLASHPHLKDDTVSTDQCDEALTAAFPWSDGPNLRRILAQSADPQTLAQEMGFI